MPLWYTSNIFAWEIIYSNDSDIPMPKEICWQMESKSELSRPEKTIKPLAQIGGDYWLPVIQRLYDPSSCSP